VVRGKGGTRRVDAIVGGAIAAGPVRVRPRDGTTNRFLRVSPVTENQILPVLSVVDDEAICLKPAYCSPSVVTS
jgi:hypothetical protein